MSAAKTGTGVEHERVWTVYRQGERMDERIPFEQISDVLAEPYTMVTLDLDRPGPGDLDAVQREFSLPKLAVEDAVHDPGRPVRGHHRPKLRQYGDVLLVVLNTVEHGEKGIGIHDLHLFVGKNFLICLRHGAPPLTEAYARAEVNPDRLATGPGFLLYAILDEIVDGYFPVLEALEQRVSDIDELIFAHGKDTDEAELVHRAKFDLVQFRRAVVPLRDEVLNYLSRPDTTVVAVARDYFRDVNDHVLRIADDIDTFRDLLTSAFEARLSYVANKQSEVTKKLAGWAAIIAVPTVIASIYGMNFKDMPELSWGFGYPVALLAMAAVSFGLYIYFHRKDWV